MIPIGSLIMLGATILNDVSVGQLTSECLGKYITLVDDFLVDQQSLKSHYQALSQHRSLLSSSDFVEVENLLRESVIVRSDLATRYSKSLQDVRFGRSSSQKTLQIVDGFLAGNSSPEMLMAPVKTHGGKFKFICMAVELGAEFMGDSQWPLKEFLSNYQVSKNSYVFLLRNLSMDLLEVSYISRGRRHGWSNLLRLRTVLFRQNEFRLPGPKSSFGL